MFGFDGRGLQALAQTISLFRSKNVASLLPILDQPKINFDLQGYVKHSSLLKKKPLEGSKVKGTAEYKSGSHSVTGEVNYRPGKGKGSASATYKYKFKKGGQI